MPEPGKDDDPVFVVRSMALDAWGLHLLRCATCARTGELCEVAAAFVASFGDHLAIR